MEKFVSNEEFENNLALQLEMTPQTLIQLRKINITEKDELKLEYFFYTDNEENANNLSNEFKKINYKSEVVFDNEEYLITGWSIKMKMSNEVVLEWTKQMCEIGYKFDCEFDGWGTTPNQ